MSSIVLRPWPFNDRIVKLHWFGNVHLTKSKRWRINVAFEDQQDIVLIKYPIGLLPLLKIGQYYQNGQAFSQRIGIVDIAHIKDLSDGHTANSLDACRLFNYYLYGNAELIRQNVWCFHSNGIHYYIPHIELVRALFAKNKVLANALLRPNELVYLLDYYHQNGRHAVFDFSRYIPASVVSDTFVQHFTWLFLVPEIRKSFESVLTNMYAQVATSNYGFSYGNAIELTIPKLLNSEWTFRGKYFSQHVLVYELLGFSVGELPVDQIDYSHQSIKKRVYISNPKKKLVTPKPQDKIFEIDNKDENQAKENTHQPIVESQATQMIFVKKPEINRIAKYEQQVNQGDSYNSKHGRGGSIFTLTSVDESIAGGNIQPLEFNTLEITYERDGFGLEDFYKMIKLLEEMFPKLRVSLNLVNLPTGRKFSWLPDGRRRVCAVVRVLQTGRITNYILEVARPDQRSLSTLILHFTEAKNLEVEEKAVQHLLRSLVLNSGSWPTERLQEVRHAKLKHTDTEPRHWAERVYEKLILKYQF